MKIFKDRQAAGKLLAKRLKHYFNDRGTIVLATPRGGVVVAKQIAQELKLPLDIIVTRKIGSPSQEELALGAVDGDGEVFWDQNLINDLGFKIYDLRGKVEDEVKEIKRREEVYRQGRKPLNVKNKTALLVDDGVATGATTLASINFLKRKGIKKIILAAPVASIEAEKRLKEQVDEAIILETPQYFQAVGQFYHHFLPVSDQEVVELLSNE